eukprot:TRINITY_DN25762_c0_g1_i2.p1 TRINITY_DN25762_c0_g1~~TRINITY_DN25762_c0_g1_i2.p1  ORF type:complete len:202 (+),score=23.25 TRINITY_DN25762_c0_g1_i2:77-682(+)
MEADEEDEICPLCMENYDVTDKNFSPCKCGFKVCIFCWHKLRETSFTGKASCPNCRALYNPSKLKFKAPDPDEVKAHLERKRKQVEDRRKQQETPSSPLTPVSPPSRKHLSDLRVIQRNLVYVIGLLSTISEEELAAESLFGQYGKIVKIMLNRASSPLGRQRPATMSAYITYSTPSEAMNCIHHVDGAWLDGKVIRCGQY